MRYDDPPEFVIWNDKIRRARDEREAHPIISAPVCEVCGSNSAKAVCAGCRIEEKP